MNNLEEIKRYNELIGDPLITILSTESIKLKDESGAGDSYDVHEYVEKHVTYILRELI